MSDSKNNLIKICFATNEYPPDIGGVSKSAKRIVHLLKSYGFDVHVFSPNYTENVENSYIPFTTEVIDGVKIYRVKCKNNESMVKSFYYSIDMMNQKIGFDLFHGFFLFMAYPCMLVSKKNKKPLIASFRGIDALWMQEAQYKLLAKEILKNSNWITSVSSDSIKQANEIYDISNKSSFIFNSLDTTNHPEWNLNEKNRNVIGTVSTFREKKNIPMLLDAYYQVDEKLKKHLLLVGDFINNKVIDYEKKEEFLNKIKNYNLSDQVTITGYIENNKIVDYLMQMNIFTLTSDHEGLPNAIIEALAVGLPIVSTEVDGVKDILVDGLNALLVPINDTFAMKKALERILIDDKLALKLSFEARNLSKKLSPEKEQKEWVNLYNKLLNNMPNFDF